ncbi:hypothetical protein [Billgrantia antri]|uniref:Uncharacterized protein n=1 Tax=Billgrantia antri TaxID=2846777 RepID=A0ABS6ZLW5_9GAMM|nr:hypothetical protein [Halomonas antri]MBW6391061.1 hypothetical protein [Halomonas antri]
MRKVRRLKGKGIWLVWGVVALCYLVPYTLFSDVARWYSSLLFWATRCLIPPGRGLPGAGSCAPGGRGSPRALA